MKRVSLLALSVLLFVLLVFSLSGCTDKYTVADIKQGRYTFDDSSIIVKADLKLTFENVDFSEVQAFYDTNNINIDLSERTAGDVYFEVANEEPSRMYVLTDEVMVLNMVYDFKHKRIEFLGNSYVFEE